MGDTAEAPAAIERPETWTSDVIVGKYVQIRDKISEIKKRQSAELAQYTGLLGTMENWLLDDLNAQGAQSIKTMQGTFYRATQVSAKVTNWHDTLDFIRNNEAWDLLEARVSKTVAEAVVTETKQPIPGVEIVRGYTLNVRRS